MLQKEKGIYLGQRVLSLEAVGIYVPGGRAQYPSSVLMNALPAKIAGVQNVVMVTPPDKMELFTLILRMRLNLPV